MFLRQLSVNHSSFLFIYCHTDFLKTIDLGKYDIQRLRETIARIDEQTKDGKFTEELLSKLEKQQKA